jgi:hypothetical protein
VLQHLSKFLVMACLLTLGACANPQLRLYDGGQKPDSKIALVTLPEAIEAARLNGVEVKGASGLWTRGDKVLELTPGRYELLAFYREVWEHGDSHDVLRSDPVLFVIEAKPGEQYRVEYVHPDNYAQARQLAADFSAVLVNEATGKRTASQPSGVRFPTGLMAQFSGASELESADGQARPGQQQVIEPMGAAAARSVSPEPVTDQRAAERAASPATPRDADWVGLMQAWWKQASPAERRAFLRWVGEQPN